MTYAQTTAYSPNVVHVCHEIPFNLPKEENFVYGTMETQDMLLRCKESGEPIQMCININLPCSNVSTTSGVI